MWFLNGLNASKLVVSTDIGFDSIDNTSFLQFAFDETTEDTIVVDNVGMDWNTGPLSILRNDVTIIFNSNGQQLKYFKNQNNNFWIDVNQFSPGIYFLEIRINETNKYNYQKLIKQ